MAGKQGEVDPAAGQWLPIPLCFLICIVRVLSPTHECCGDETRVWGGSSVPVTAGRGLPGFPGRSVCRLLGPERGKFNLKEVKFSFLPSVSLCLREQLLS